MSEDIARLGLYVDSSGVVRATGKLKKFEGQAGKTEKSAGRLTKGLGAMQTVAVALASSLVVSKFIQTAGAFESMKVSLETVTGSAEKAEMAFSGIQELAKNTPFSVQELTESFIKLKALGIEPTEKNLISFGNTSSAMGKSLNQMIEAVADAATGEFERLKEFGIKARKQGDDVSFTFQGITTTVKNNSEAITGYLEGIGSTQFAGAMEKQMDTINGKISNLGDSFDNLLVTFSEAGGGEGTKSALDVMISAVDTLTAGIEKLPGLFIALYAEVDKFLTFFSFKSEEETQKEIARINKVAQAAISAEQKKLEAKSGGIDEAGKKGPVVQTQAELDAEAAKNEQLMAMSRAFQEMNAEERLAAKQALLEEEANLERFAEAQRIQAAQIAQEQSAEAARQSLAQKVQLTGEIMGNLSTLTASTSKKMFNLGKAASLASALINTYQAVTKTMAETPYPWNIPLAAAQAAAGLVQVQNIKAQKFSGQAHQGMDFVESDGSFQLKRGEMVLDKGTSEKVRNNVTGGATIHFSPVIQAFDADELMENKDKLFNSMYNRLRERMNEEGFNFA